MIALDKQAHFWAGAAIAASVTLYSGDPISGIGAGVLAGALKEGLDMTGRGTPDFKDFIFTCVGAAVPMLPLILL